MMKNKNRLIAMFLALLIVLTAVPASAAERTDVPDTAMNYSVYTNQVGKVYSLDDTSASPVAAAFNYTVPEDGATLVYFIMAQDHTRDSEDMLKDFAYTQWAYEDNINIIAVDCSGASRETVAAFVAENDAEGLVDHVYYSDKQPGYLVAWYLESISRKGNMDNVYSFKQSYSPVHALIITNRDGQKMINYSVSGIYNNQAVTALLGSVADIPEGHNETVGVRIAGTMHYENVAPVFDLVNESREGIGKTALTLSPQLTEIAMKRAYECAVYYNHIRPNGFSCFSLGNEMAVYTTGLFAAENIACGQKTPEGVMESWLNSPGHYKNIMGEYTQIGIGCFENNGIKYWVQAFGDGNDTSTLQIVEPIEVICDVETLESRISDRTEITSLTVHEDSETQLKIVNYNTGTGEFDFRTELLPTQYAYTDEEGAVVAYTDNDGVLHTVKPGTCEVTLRAYSGEKSERTFTLTVVPHSWGQGYLTVKPSCTEDGLRIYSCSGCSKIKQENIPAAHKYSDEFTVDREPTLTVPGEKSRHCTVCGDRIDITEIPIPAVSLLGDVNVDGDVNMKDILLLRRFVAGIAKLTTQGRINADVNLDLDLNMKDVLVLRRYVAGIGALGRQ